MTEKVVIVNKDSITKRLALVAGVSLASFFLFYSLPKIVTTMREEREYKQKMIREENECEEKVSDVKEEIYDGKFDLAEKLIKNYENGKLFSEGDVLMLTSLLTVRREETEKKERASLEEKLLREAELRKELSQENMLQKIRTSLGEEKIGLIEKFNALYSTDELVSTLKQEELDAYLLICESYFTTNSQGLALQEALNKFHFFLANNEQLLQKDFSEFFRLGEEYISLMKDQKPIMIRNFRIGDRVALVKKLGSFNGHGENEYYNEYSNYNEFFSLGRIGEICSVNRTEGYCQVIFRFENNSYVGNFQEGEIELIESSDQITNVGSLAKIQQYLTSIKQLVEESNE